jgi:hypothetical protein
VGKICESCIGLIQLRFIRPIQQEEQSTQYFGLDSHKVSQNECEQVFFNVPLLGRNDAEHSVEEKKYENNDL